VSPAFVPALELNAGFYRDVLAPLLEPWPHAAGHLGFGSDILGFDSERSTDHGWGPRGYVFVAPEHLAAARAAIDAGLPETYRDWPVAFGWDEVRVTHHVHVLPLTQWLDQWLGVNPLVGMTTVDWLITPQQRILGVVRGAVFHDDSGELTTVREQLRYFPENVQRWMIACQWRRIEQEEPFVGRTAEVGDEVGSRLIAARQVRELMRLHFLLEGEYWPYAKWFGTAYRALAESEPLLAMFDAALGASTPAAREDALVPAYETLARLYNDRSGTDPVEPTVRQFYGRPFRTLASDRFVAASLAGISDPWLRALPIVGSIDQFADSTDVLQHPAVSRRLRAIYDA
jgi:hypothetical protein